MDGRAGRQLPEGFVAERPWDFVFGALARDEQFWQTQVHAPALAWIAAGSHGTPRTPAEQLATGYLQGGLNAISPVMESNQNTKVQSATEPNPYRRKRRRGKADTSAGEDHRSKNASGEKGKGKGGGKGTSAQLCYSWNNGNGACGSLPPGQKCLAKTPRLHRCTICNSPGHPSKDCTKKDQ